MKTKLIKLNNGGELLYSPRKNAKAISVVFYFKAGAINDPSKKKGLLIFVSMLLCRLAQQQKHNK